jgi:hypothetical protein
MIKAIIGQCFILICISFIACRNNSSESTNHLPENPKYYMVIGNVEMNLENKGDIKVGGGYWGGSVTIYINNNPMKIMTNGGTLTYLTYYIKPGENIISLKGSASKNIYLKIVEMSKPEMNKPMVVKKVFVADKIPPESINGYSKTITFDTVYTPSFFEGLAPKKDDKNRMDIESAVNTLYRDLSMQNKSAFFKVAAEGAILRNQGSTRSKSVKQLKDSIYFFYFARELDKYNAFNDSELQIVWGDRTVLVFCGYHETKIFDESPPLIDPYLFTFKQKDSKFEGIIPPVALAYINNRWLVWDLDF